MASSTNVGLSRVVQAVLAATALAPVLLVWGAARYGVAPIETSWAVAGAMALVGLCLCILWLARRTLQTEPLPLKKTSRLDRDAVAFLVAYALPLVTSSGKDTNLPALAVFMVILGVVLVQLHVLYVNPLLGMLGFHFYAIENADGDTALVLCRTGHVPRPGAMGQRLGPTLWLLAGDDQPSA